MTETEAQKIVATYGCNVQARDGGFWIREGNNADDAMFVSRTGIIDIITVNAQAYMAALALSWAVLMPPEIGRDQRGALGEGKGG